MVYITSEDGKEKKFACIKCIKGHRSTKCNHANRELFEIKKKGRPVSQCDTCRQLRKTKQIHIKCMCHLDIKLKDALNTPVRDEKFRYSDLSANGNINKPSTSQGSCTKCNRPSLYCICSKDNTTQTKSQDIDYLSSGSSDGSITPPIYTLGYPENPIRPAGLNVNSSSSSTYPKRCHLTKPIHDPSDDINSDTPIYKSHEHKPAILGQFTSSSSEDLMNQIYSGFIDKNKDSLKETDHQLVELSEND